MDANTFFSNLKNDIANSKTSKTLKILGKRAKRFVEEVNNSNASSAYKNMVMKAYRDSMKMINKMKKRFS